jgi:PilZ domain
MNLIDNFAELSSGRAGAGTARRRAMRRTTPADARGLHAALAQEAHDAAILVAATGSIVNAIVACKRPQLRTCMATYLPPQPTLFPSAISSSAASKALSTEAVQGLSSFYSVTAFARSATLSYSARREPGGITGPISMETLGEAWQSAAMQGIGVLATMGFLDAESGLFEKTGDNTASLRLVEMLWGVTAGRSPCVRIDGAVIVPGWIERRTHLRREINAPATLSHNGANQKVTVRDLSAGGIGIDGGVGIEPGDEVNVSLGGGVRFEGVAIWNRDGRVGVKLSAPLKSPVSED